MSQAEPDGGRTDVGRETLQEKSMELVIGTKAWSTWSMRPWLALKQTGAAFTETLIALRQENGLTEAAIKLHSATGLVPALKDGDLTVCDSLAICEYLAERFPAAGLWPADPAVRGPRAVGGRRDAFGFRRPAR